jgi:hypothetical protein
MLTHGMMDISWPCEARGAKPMGKPYRWKRGNKPQWAYKQEPEYQDSVKRFVAAVEGSPGRRLLDELLDPFRVHAASDPERQTLAFQLVMRAMPARRAPPLHTAAELALMWPMICKGLLEMERAPKIEPIDMTHKLAKAGLPVARNADGRPGHIWHGRRQVYYWTTAPFPSRASLLTQEQFEAIMRESFMEG